MVEGVIGKASYWRADVAFGIIAECPSNKFYSIYAFPKVLNLDQGQKICGNSNVG